MKRVTKVDPATRAVYLETDAETARRKLAQYEDVCPCPEELRRMRNFYFASHPDGCACDREEEEHADK